MQRLLKVAARKLGQSRPSLPHSIFGFDLFTSRNSIMKLSEIRGELREMLDSRKRNEEKKDKREKSAKSPLEVGRRLRKRPEPVTVIEAPKNKD